MVGAPVGTTQPSRFETMASRSGANGVRRPRSRTQRWLAKAHAETPDETVVGVRVFASTTTETLVAVLGAARGPDCDINAMSLEAREGGGSATCRYWAPIVDFGQPASWLAEHVDALELADAKARRVAEDRGLGPSPATLEQRFADHRAALTACLREDADFVHGAAPGDTILVFFGPADGGSGEGELRVLQWDPDPHYVSASLEACVAGVFGVDALDPSQKGAEHYYSTAQTELAFELRVDAKP